MDQLTDDLQKDMQNAFAMTGVMNIMITIICILFAWWALKQFKFDLFLKDPRSIPSGTLKVMAAVALGYQLARFIIDYFQWSTSLKGLFY
jgi:uncharacterized membrane protein YwzB